MSHYEVQVGESSGQVIHPLFNSDGSCEGWYEFKDLYLSPQVLYGSWPPVTTLKFGGRLLIVEKPVSVKIELKDNKDYERYWSNRTQHSESINLKNYHCDFSDVEIAYSFSYPRTHIWFNRYLIHFDNFENISVSSYNATVCIRPEHVLDLNSFEAKKQAIDQAQDKIFGERTINGNSKAFDNTTIHNENNVIVEGAPHFGSTMRPFFTEERNSDSLVLHSKNYQHLGNHDTLACSQTNVNTLSYTAKVPTSAETIDSHIDANGQYYYTQIHFNDCDRPVHIREQFTVNVGITSKSSPFDVPPTFPPPNPFTLQSAAKPKCLDTFNSSTRGALTSGSTGVSQSFSALQKRAKSTVHAKASRFCCSMPGIYDKCFSVEISELPQPLKQLKANMPNSSDTDLEFLRKRYFFNMSPLAARPCYNSPCNHALGAHPKRSMISLGTSPGIPASWKCCHPAYQVIR